MLRPRHLIGDAGLGDLVAGAHQPLGHGRLGIEEGVGHLFGFKPQTERNVKATAVLRSMAGWQQVKISFSRSSSDRLRLGPVCGVGIEIDQMGDLGGFGAEAGGAPERSMALRRAACITQAGERGGPLRDQ